MKKLEEKLNRKIDLCPFCGHIIMSRNSKCPSCRKKLEEIFFQKLHCPHCKNQAYLENGGCSKCGEKINIPDFEYGKYIEITKKRRINLVTEKEEEFYQKLKFDHFGRRSGEKFNYLMDRTSKDRKLFMIFLNSAPAVYLFFVILALFTNIFQADVDPKTLSQKSFFMPVWIWFVIKTVVFSGLYFLARKKPVYAYLTAFVIITMTFLFESLTFPVFPAIYIISQIIVFLVLIYGVKLTLNYEDFLTHFGNPYELDND